MKAPKQIFFRFRGIFPFLRTVPAVFAVLVSSCSNPMFFPENKPGIVPGPTVEAVAAKGYGTNNVIYYASLQDAVDNAAGGVITIIKDIELSTRIYITSLGCSLTTPPSTTYRIYPAPGFSGIELIFVLSGTVNLGLGGTGKMLIIDGSAITWAVNNAGGTVTKHTNDCTVIGSTNGIILTSP